MEVAIGLHLLVTENSYLYRVLTTSSERPQMFIAIIGTRCSGKTCVKDYLMSKGFKWVSLTDEGIYEVCKSSPPHQLLFYNYSSGTRNKPGSNSPQNTRHPMEHHL